MVVLVAATVINYIIYIGIVARSVSGVLSTSSTELPFSSLASLISAPFSMVPLAFAPTVKVISTEVEAPGQFTLNSIGGGIITIISPVVVV